MGKNKTIVSLNQVIGIREFMETYLNVKYEYDDKLTHYKMFEYLMEKGETLPTRVNLKEVNDQTLNNGTYVLVREESSKKKKGKMIAYENPLVLKFGRLLNELQESKDYKKLRLIRKAILSQENLEEDWLGNIVDKVPEEEELVINVSVNRQKRYVSNSQRHIKGKGGY
jgi:hypothetical protein